MPELGEVHDGYLFIGGDPNEPTSWQPLESEAAQFALRPEPVVGFGDPGLEASAVEGGFAGFAGELGGGIKAATDWLAAQAQGKDIPYGELYDVNRAILEAQLGKVAEESPIASTVAEVAGAIPSSLLMPGMKAATLPGMMRAGAGYGGLYGTGKAETTKDIPAEMTKGALLGAAAPVGLRGALGAGRLLGRGMVASGRGVAKAVSPQVNDAAAKPALKAIERAFKRDGMTLEQGMKELKKLGPDAVLADVGGKNVQRLAGEVARLPGTSADVAERTLQTRMTGSASRLATALNKALGAKTTAYKAGKDIIAQRNSQAGPLYTEAFEQSVDPGKMNALIAQLDDTARAASGTKIGANIKGVINSLGKRVNGEIVPKLGVQQLHMAKMDLDGKIGTAIRQGNKPLAAELMKAKQGLLGVLDDIPQYQQARQIFSDDSAVLNAIERGKQILRVDAEEMADMVQTMSKADWDGYILGASKAITDKLKTVGQTGNAASRISTHLVRDRIRNAFPSEEAFESFMKQVNIEDTFAQLRNVATRGSQTAERLATGDGVAFDAASDILQAGLYRTVINSVAGFVKQFKQIPEPTRDKIGDLLFSDIVNQGAVSKKLMDKMVKSGIRREQVQTMINEINSTLTRPATAAAMAE